MTRCVLFLAYAVLFSLVPTAWTQEDEASKQPIVAEAMAKLANLGPGVHNIQKDKKGRIISCVVVGQTRISTALGKAKGLELARDKASLASSAEFVKWLKEEVTVYQSNDEETVTLLDGEEGSGVDSLKESAKSVDKSSKKMESLSKGLVRGLKMLHKDVDGEGKTYTIIKAWKADTAEGVKKIAADLVSDEPGGDKQKNKKIESSSATSDDAAEFLPKPKK